MGEGRKRNRYTGYRKYRLFQSAGTEIFSQAKVTHIHLDEMGSFVWPIMDGEKDIIAIGKEVEEQFGEKANPLYERLAKFFQVLDSYHFITWN